MNFIAHIFTATNSLILRLLSLVSLSISSISFALQVDFFLAIIKFLSHLLASSHLTLHPRVTNNVSHAQSLVREKLQHIGYQVLEVIRVKASLLS
jgi:hypothetical protein